MRNPPRRWSDNLFSDALLPEGALRVRAEVRRFADDVLRPIAHELNTTPETRDGFRHDLVKAIAAAGLYQVPFAKDIGGRGLKLPTPICRRLPCRPWRHRSMAAIASTAANAGSPIQWPAISYCCCAAPAMH